VFGEELADLLLAGCQAPFGKKHLGVVGEQVQDAAAVGSHALVVERLQVLERDRLALLVGHRHSADGHEVSFGPRSVNFVIRGRA
jgi:hypothetical protein